MNFTIFAITIFETIDYFLVSSIVSHLILLNIFLSLFAWDFSPLMTLILNLKSTQNSMTHVYKNIQKINTKMKSKNTIIVMQVPYGIDSKALIFPPSDSRSAII